MRSYYSSCLRISAHLILILLSLAGSACSKEYKNNIVGNDNPAIFKIWALADLQPRNNKERNAFSRAVEDVNNNTNGIDMAVVAGDIASRPDAGLYEWYNETKRGSYIKDWFEIIGNHDLKDDDGEMFRKFVRKETDYSIERGNMLFLFLSDSQKGKPTEISDDTFEWWKHMVINNQDKVIIVVSHAPLEGSSIAFSSLSDRQIRESNRFAEVLENYTVDVWLSGHLHIPNAFVNTVVREKDFSETVFIHISSIRPELFGLKNSESRFLSFYCGTRKLRIDSRDHDSQRWHRDLVYEYLLSREIVCH